MKLSNISKLSQIFIILAVVAFAIACVVWVPFIILWAINTLFNVDNPYDFTHWGAALVFASSMTAYYQFPKRK